MMELIVAFEIKVFIRDKRMTFNVWYFTVILELMRECRWFLKGINKFLN